MGEVTVTVNGRPYRMACEDGQEGHLHKLGQDLAGRVTDLASQVGQVGDAQLLVMAALITADEALEASGGAGGDNSALIAERDALQAELEAARAVHAALQAANSDNSSVTAEALAERDALRAERATLVSELESLRAAHVALEAADSDDDNVAVAEAAAERDALRAELAALRVEHAALREARAAQAKAEANATEAIEALSGRVARLAEALLPH